MCPPSPPSTSSSSSMARWLFNACSPNRKKRTQVAPPKYHALFPSCMGNPPLCRETPLLIWIRATWVLRRASEALILYWSLWISIRPSWAEKISLRSKQWWCSTSRCKKSKITTKWWNYSLKSPPSCASKSQWRNWASTMTFTRPQSKMSKFQWLKGSRFDSDIRQDIS